MSNPLENVEGAMELIGVLIEEGHKFFLGGSRRFGYYDRNSDADIFVLDAGIPLIQDLEALGFEQVFHHVVHSEYPVAALYTKDKIHVGIIRPVRFHFLEKEHDNVEEMIVDLPGFISVAKKMKKHEVSGSRVYQFLTRVCLHWQIMKPKVPLKKVVAAL